MQSIPNILGQILAKHTASLAFFKNWETLQILDFFEVSPAKSWLYWLLYDWLFFLDLFGLNHLFFSHWL